jgi:hypothetical protein
MTGIATSTTNTSANVSKSDYSSSAWSSDPESLSESDGTNTTDRAIESSLVHSTSNASSSDVSSSDDPSSSNKSEFLMRGGSGSKASNNVSGKTIMRAGFLNLDVNSANSYYSESTSAEDGLCE